VQRLTYGYLPSHRASLLCHLPNYTARWWRPMGWFTTCPALLTWWQFGWELNPQPLDHFSNTSTIMPARHLDVIRLFGTVVLLPQADTAAGTRGWPGSVHHDWFLLEWRWYVLHQNECSTCASSNGCFASNYAVTIVNYCLIVNCGRHWIDVQWWKPHVCVTRYEMCIVLNLMVVRSWCIYIVVVIVIVCV